jgi:outer membrane protein TolC
VQELLYIKEQIAREIEKLSFVTIKDIEAKSFIKKFKIDTYKAINSHPTIRALEQKIESIKSQIELEKAKKVADIKVGIGYFNRDGFDDYASINFSMPLKITDRESINIKQKRLELNILNLKLKNSKYIMKKDIANLKKWLNKSIKNIKILDKRVLKTNSQLKTLIKEYAKTTDSNSLKLYKNQNRKIELELLKIDEMILYYQAYSKLLYYGGRR